MTEEITEVVETEVVTKELTPEEKKNAHKEKQGEKTTEKKKVKFYTAEECKAELSRLSKTNHQDSKYYEEVRKRAVTLGV